MDAEELQKIIGLLTDFIPYPVNEHNLFATIKYLVDEVDSLNSVIFSLNTEIENLEDELEMYKEEDMYS